MVNQQYQKTRKRKLFWLAELLFPTNWLVGKLSLWFFPHYLGGQKQPHSKGLLSLLATNSTAESSQPALAPRSPVWFWLPGSSPLIGESHGETPFGTSFFPAAATAAWVAATTAATARGAILTRYDLARGPSPSKMVGPSFSCFRKCRSRLVCCPKQRSHNGHR